MHNLAIALQNKGYQITGSDDKIYDPARSNLKEANLLPKEGWHASAISNDIDAIIIGMHAKGDNPELLAAQNLKIPIFSFPEFIANESKDKKRIVVAGSHGKTTTTAMLMHSLKENNFDFDYVVGSSIDGFDLSVKLSNAPIIVIEGDEYLTSPLDLRSKFHWYNPDLTIITGIAYDHINVFPTFDLYLDTFREFIKNHKKSSSIFWFDGDEELQKMIHLSKGETQAYETPSYKVNKGNVSIISDNKDYSIKIVGEHNLQNLAAAGWVMSKLGCNKEVFLNSMQNFAGAGRRMEKIYDENNQVVYRDFAHSPSKLQATTQAVSKTYDKPLLAVFEMHTFSSLNKAFLPFYNGAMDEADKAIVFVDANVFEHKKMEVLSLDFIKQQFGNVTVINNAKQLALEVSNHFLNGFNILLMSSGQFAGAEFSFDTNLPNRQ